MNERLTELLRLASYLLWEVTELDNALEHWYCAEDIACFMEEFGILTESDVTAIKAKGKEDPGYIQFIREYAFRLFVYTGNNDAAANWFRAEMLLNNPEWVRTMVQIAGIYSEGKLTGDFISRVRSGKVRSYYRKN